MKVLIVDDFEDVRIILTTALEDAGYVVEEASNGVQALERIHCSPPDLIISDILMPEMDGFELCRAVKSDQQLQNIPYIFYTATFVDPGAEALAKTLGALRFLIKPMETDKLLKEVREVLQEYEEDKLAAPEHSFEDVPETSRLYAENLARKLDKKIRELERERQALKESEEHKRLLLMSTGEAIYAIDPGGNCTFINPACLRILGYQDQAEILDKNMHMLIHHSRPDGSSYPVEECRIYRALRDGKGTHMEDEVLWRQDGTSFPAECWSYPILKDDQVVGSVVTFLDITERKRIEDDRQKLLEENRQLLKQSMRIQEDERRYIARELHDELGQALAGIRMDIDFIRGTITDPTSREMVAAEDIQTILDETTSRVRQMTERLRPTMLDYLGLEGALEEMVEKWTSRNRNIACSFTVTGKLDGLSEALNLTLYRLIQESLTNVARHAAADHVEIRIERQADRIIMAIQDDGQGVDTSRVASGMGQLGMRERVWAAGGEFEIKSKPGYGLTVSVSLPLPGNGHQDNEVRHE